MRQHEWHSKPPLYFTHYLAYRQMKEFLRMRTYTSTCLTSLFLVLALLGTCLPVPRAAAQSPNQLTLDSVNAAPGASGSFPDDSL